MTGISVLSSLIFFLSNGRPSLGFSFVYLFTLMATTTFLSYLSFRPTATPTIPAALASTAAAETTIKTTTKITSASRPTIKTNPMNLCGDAVHHPCLQEGGFLLLLQHEPRYLFLDLNNLDDGGGFPQTLLYVHQDPHHDH